MAGQMHNGLAARDKGPLAALPCVGAGNASQKATGLPGLTAKAVCQQNRLVPFGAAGVRSGTAQLPHAAGDFCGHVGQRFGRFLPQQGRSSRGERQPVFFRNSSSLCAGRAVRAGRAAGDHIERVAENVAEHHAVHRGGRTGQREPPALDGRQPLADRVDLNNIRTAGQKRLCDGLQLLSGQQRFFKQRAAAAGEQKQHGVVRPQTADKRQRPLGGRKAVVVRHRMPCLAAGHAGQRPPDMAVFCDDDPAVHTAQHGQRRVGHLPRGLARRHEKYTPLRVKMLQSAAHRLIRQNGPDGRCPNRFCALAQELLHCVAPFLS